MDTRFDHLTGVWVLTKGSLSSLLDNGGAESGVAECGMLPDVGQWCQTEELRVLTNP